MVFEAQEKSPRTRRVSREKNIELADLPTARDTKIVSIYVNIIKQYHKEQIDAKTFVDSLNKDVWTMLRELKAAGKDAFEILDREEFKNTIDKYGAADSIRYLERLEGYLYGKVSRFDASKSAKKDRPPLDMGEVNTSEYKAYLEHYQTRELDTGKFWLLNEN